MSYLLSHSLKLFQEAPVGPKLLSIKSSIIEPTVFTDGSEKTGKAAVIWKINGNWQHMITIQTDSPQIVEL